MARETDDEVGVKAAIKETDW
jgi:hypothetical protein